MFFINPFIYAGGGDFESIATITQSTTAASMEFTNIPSTYQHLQIRGIVRNASTNGNDLYLQFNGNTGSSYTFHQLSGNGSSASASGSTGITGASMAQTSNTASTFGAFIIDILDYASTTKNPVFRCFGGYETNTVGFVSLRSSMYNGTGAITSIKLFQGGSVNQTQYTTAALYGVRAP
jgi:hypothetical protein